MKTTCNRQKLLEAFQVAGSVVAASTTKPILQDLKIVAHGNNIDVYGTDLEVGIRVTVSDNEVAEEGAIVLPASRVTDILRELSDETVNITVKKETCEITGQDSFFSVVGENADQFPVFSDFPEGPALTMSGEQLIEMARKTVFAVATEEGRYAINGVLIAVDGETVEMVGTDGRRLAVSKGRIENPTGYAGSVIVPAKAISELERLMDKDETVSLCFEESQILMAGPRGHLCAQLVEGQFPKYIDVIPADLDQKVVFNCEQFQAITRRASLLSDPQSRSVKFQFDKGKLTASSQSPGAGEARIEMNIDYEGDSVGLSFNPDFLLNVLRILDTESVDFEFKDHERPGLFRVGSEYLYLIMPVSLD